MTSDKEDSPEVPGSQIPVLLRVCLRAAATLGTCGAVATLGPTTKSGQRMGESFWMVLARRQGSSPPRGGSGSEPLLARLLRAGRALAGSRPYVEGWCSQFPPTTGVGRQPCIQSRKVLDHNPGLIVEHIPTSPASVMTVPDSILRASGQFTTV